VFGVGTTEPFLDHQARLKVRWSVIRKNSDAKPYQCFEVCFWHWNIKR